MNQFTAPVGIAKLYTLDEVAEMLRKSPSQLRWMIHNSTAPKSGLLGGRRMFRSTDIADWINAAFDAEATK